MYAFSALFFFMFFQNGMRNIAMAYQLDRTVIIVQLLFCNFIRIVAMDSAVDAYDGFDDTCNGADVMRYHDDGHLAVQCSENIVQLFFEFVIHEIGGFIQNQQFRVGDQGPAE